MLFHSIPSILADNTSLSCFGNTPTGKGVDDKIQREVNYFSGWCAVNVLSYSCSKFEQAELLMSLAGNILEQVQVMKYLGLHLNSNLTIQQ